MKKKQVIAICIIAALAISLILVAYNSYRNTQVDTLWVETANSMLKDYPSYVNDSRVDNNPDWGLSILQLHFLENGTNRILYVGNGDTLCNYLINLLKQNSIQKGTISQEQLEKILDIKQSFRNNIDFTLKFNHITTIQPTSF